MYNLSWIVENRVLLLRNEGKLTGSDLQKMSRELDTMMTNAVAPLHIIEDDRDLQTVADWDLQAMRQTISAVDFAKLGYAMAIVPEKMEGVADVLGNFWELISDVNYERVQTVPEAIDFLAKHDASLPERSKWQLELA